MGAPPLDPELREELDAMPAVPTLTAASLVAVRAAVAGGVAGSGEVEHVDLDLPGDPAVRVRLHRSVGGSGLRPCLLSVHGGGFVVGSALADDALFEAWCQGLGCVGVSVDYRLAPETPYPGALEDCHRALSWVREHAAALDIDPGRIGLFGVSAGGGLAAGLSLRLRDRGEPPVAFQVLLYPMLDDRQATPSSAWDDVARWDPASNRFAWRSYLGARHGTGDVPAYAAPARAADLSGLPPTCVVVGTADGFLDEDLLFAQRLAHAAVAVEVHVYAGGAHGFAAPAIRAPIAARARDAIDDYLVRYLAPDRALDGPLDRALDPPTPHLATPEGVT